MWKDFISCKVEFSVTIEFTFPICPIDFFEFCGVLCQHCTFDVIACSVSRSKDAVFSDGRIPVMHMMFSYNVSLVRVDDGDPWSAQMIQRPPFLPLPTMVVEGIATETGDHFPVVICWSYLMLFLFGLWNWFTGIAACFTFRVI